MLNIHASLVSLDNKGILLLGKSGSGKSDLALRLIMEQKAILVADDRVNLDIINGKLYGKSPKELVGKLEIRHLGIGSFPVKKQEEISLCIELIKNRNDLERYPTQEYIDFLGVSITKIKLYPFDCSTIYKILAKINKQISL